MLLFWKKLIAFLMALTVFLSAQLGTAVGVTEGEAIEATRRDYCYDNERLLIGGYNYDHRHADNEHVAWVNEAGIDFLIAWANDNFLDLCHANGVGVIAKGYNAPAMYWDAGNTAPWYAISPDTYKDHPALWGDDLIDEPTAAGFASLGRVVNHYHANTAGKLPLINLFPLYANSQQLGNSPEIEWYKKLFLPLSDFSNDSIDRYKRHVSDYINKIDTDYISVDIYPLRVERTKTGERKLITYDMWLRNLDILAEACRETNRDLWVITQAAGDEIDGEGSMRYCDTPEDIRWQAFVSLAFGAKAIIHACYDSGWWDRGSHLIDGAGNRTDTYYAAKTVNFELKAFADVYGKYNNQGAFMHNGLMSRANILRFLMPVKEEFKPEIKSFSPLLVGCFEGKDDDSKAYCVVNMWEPETGNKACVQFSAEGAEQLTVYQKGVPAVIDGNKCNLLLDNREGVFITAE